VSLIKKLGTLCLIYRERDDIRLFLREKDVFNTFKFEKRAFANIELANQGAVQEDELPLLQELVQQANELPGAIIEIGTLFGFTTQKIAFWKDTAKKIITVDNYSWNPLGFSPDAHFDFTCRILWYLINTGRVELVHMSKDDFFNNYQGEAPSLVFIDADHSYEATLSDIREARRIGTRIICGHDYCDLHPGVVRAVDESGGAERLCGSVWAL
jgi:hypothetical protein